MIIGLSGGDIYLGIKLLKDTLQALSSTRGSQKQYIDAVQQLDTLEVCLKVALCKISDLQVDDATSLIAHAVEECAKCIDIYQQEILRRYEGFFGEETQGGARKKFLRELKKIQWLHEKDKTETLSKAIATHVQIITLACSIGSLSRTEGIASPGLQLHDEVSSPLRARRHLSSSILEPESSLISSLISEHVNEVDAEGKGKRRASPDDDSPVVSSTPKPSDDDILPVELDEVAEPPFTPRPPFRVSSGVSVLSSPFSISRYTPDKNSRPSASSLSRSTTMTTPTPSIFSRRPSIATQASTTTVTTTTSTMTASCVDERGVCHNAACQQHTFLQKKAFAVYARLTYRDEDAASVGREGGKPRGEKIRPTCEHTLLYLQGLVTESAP